MNNAKHAFGSSSSIEAAKQAKKIDAFDILFLDGDTDNPKVGWLDADGNTVIVSNETDLSGVEAELAKKAEAADVEALEGQIATKVDASVVDEKVGQAVTDSVASAKAYTDGKVEAAINEHMARMYEVDDVPVGTLVDYRDSEIRIMCPTGTVFTKQAVGVGGDANSYYFTFKTYAPNDNAVGYIEHLGDEVDSEILTTFSTDEYGRRYQPTWLALAKYDESTDSWSYHGKNSTTSKYIGWDYQIDWYNADGVMIASDSIRINLSNENCHYSLEPYYVGNIMKEVEEKIAESSAAIEVVEF